ncbi:tRNA (adenine(22)-N(1))-methyltransferase [Paradesulfitobacterium ferrireducens]|uniref:tRNA (adenine(22)-N(1))-methyltransferase n=1 Tax=Paradesulfitobacterium ferrireducens TaxID=2816476 RepID=UPI001A8EEA79|nr:class I SAM-dependent methyltransferase [Paradesulfitobacterium ferrireducens]
MHTASELGPRLQTIANFVPPGARLGDIGTDHAYLTLALVADGKITGAVAIDVHKGPYQSALNAVYSTGLADRIDVRFGDGLEPLVPGEVDTLVLAGMGGVTILEILNNKPEVLHEVSTLILQPQGAEGRVRESLGSRGWRLKDEVLVEEANRVYTVIVYTRQEGFTAAELGEKVRWWQDKVVQSLASASNFNSDGHAVKISEVTRSLVWEYGPLILAHGGRLLARIITENCRELTRQLEEIQKGKSGKLGRLIQDKTLELRVVESFESILAGD